MKNSKVKNSNKKSKFEKFKGNALPNKSLLTITGGMHARPRTGMNGN